MIPLLIACTDNRTTSTCSSIFTSKQDKIDFLNEYYTPRAKIRDTEFCINYHDNSTGLVTGPSDWNYRVALKINRKDISMWLFNGNDSSEIEPFDEGNWDDILPNTKYWDISGDKKQYTSGYVWIVENDILLFTISTN